MIYIVLEEPPRIGSQGDRTRQRELGSHGDWRVLGHDWGWQASVFVPTSGYAAHPPAGLALRQVLEQPRPQLQELMDHARGHNIYE